MEKCATVFYGSLKSIWTHISISHEKLWPK